MTDEEIKKFEKAMDDYFEKNKKPTLKELFEDYLSTKVDWAQSNHVIANELVDVVKKWLPKEEPTPNYYTVHWNKCIQNMRSRLR